MDQTDQLRDVLQDLTSVFHDDRLTVEFDAQPRAKPNETVVVNPEVSEVYDVDVSGEQELRCLVDTLSHEVEHVRESDLDAKRAFMEQYPDYPQFAGYVANVLEDAYIDYTRTRRHRGLKKPHAFFVDRQIIEGPSLADLGDDPDAFAACLFQLAHAGTAQGLPDAHADVRAFAARVAPLIDRVRRLEAPDDRNALAHVVTQTALEYLPDRDLDDFDPDDVPGVPNEVMANGPDPDDIDADASDADASDAEMPDSLTDEPPEDIEDVFPEATDDDADETDEDDASGTPDGDAGDTPDDAQDDEDTSDSDGADDDATDDDASDAGDDTTDDAQGDDDDAHDDAQGDVGDDAMDDDENDMGDASDASDTGDDAQQPSSADDAQDASDDDATTPDAPSEQGHGSDVDAPADDLSEREQDILDELDDRAQRDDPSRDWHDVPDDEDYHDPDETDKRRYKRLKRTEAEADTDLAERKRQRDARLDRFQHRSGAEMTKQAMEDSGLKQDVTRAFRELKTRDRDVRARSGNRVNVREYVANRAGDKSRDRLYLRRRQAEIGDRAVAVCFDASGSMDAHAARQALAAIALACDVIGDQFCAMAYSGRSASLITAPDESWEWEHLDAYNSGGNTPMPTGIQETRALLREAHKPEKVMFVVTDGKANVALSGKSSAHTARQESAELVNTVRHDDDVKVIGLGVGTGVNRSYMDTVFGGMYVMAEMTNLADELIRVYRDQMKVA